MDLIESVMWWLLEQQPIVVTVAAVAAAAGLLAWLAVQLANTREVPGGISGWEDHPGELTEIVAQTCADSDPEQVTVRMTPPGFGIVAVPPTAEFSAALKDMAAQYQATADAYVSTSAGHPPGHRCRGCDLARDVAWDVEQGADAVVELVDQLHAGPQAADQQPDTAVGYRGRHWPDTVPGVPVRYKPGPVRYGPIPVTGIWPPGVSR